ncbi:MAG: hypothetical protein MUF54_24935 [Polyangiaceae bacterium]|nr:hypothetical protein [Polyangiaceae bacterium]
MTPRPPPGSSPSLRARHPPRRAFACPPHERGRIGAFRGFLTEIIAPELAPRAAVVGYTAAEHQEAWTNIDTVDGRELTLDDALGVENEARAVKCIPI